MPQPLSALNEQQSNSSSNSMAPKKIKQIKNHRKLSPEYLKMVGPRRAGGAFARFQKANGL